MIESSIAPFLLLSSGILVLLTILLLTLPAYAEIHYRRRWIPSVLYRKEPEVIFDLPFRAIRGSSIPLFLIIKDANQFPIESIEISVCIHRPQDGHICYWKGEYEKHITEYMRLEIIDLPATYFEKSGEYEVTAFLDFRVNGKLRRIKQDNYRTLSQPPFRLVVAEAGLPALPGCHWGDIHIHTSYTDDPVEFGAPIPAIVACCECIGLSFVALTDHSFDLDDQPGKWMTPDPDLTRWREFLCECDTRDQQAGKVVILPGEEVSSGNGQGENVHCLVLGNRHFYPGGGDGGDSLRNTAPTLSLEALYAEVRRKDDAIIAAAHPFDKPPAVQRFLLNRGAWRTMDLANPNLDYWQLLNGRIDDNFYRGMSEWTRALLRGSRVGIIGGTDAHGNFNSFRQIRIPFFKMMANREQLLGQTCSGVLTDGPLTRESLLQALKEKRVIISTGPCAKLEIVQTGKVFPIGSTISAGSSFEIQIQALSSKEFGALARVSLYYGRLNAKQEIVEELASQSSRFDFKGSRAYPDGAAAGYFRLEVHTRRDDQTFFCCTNPLWIA